MNTRYFFYLLLTLSVSAFLTSCAKDAIEDRDTAERRVLDAHLKVVYADTLAPLSTGVYIMTRKKGNGSVVKDKDYVFVRYSTLDLKNNYTVTSVEDIAKQTGVFSFSTYYGPVLYEVSENTLTRGLHEAMKTLREGSDVRIIIPSWASDYAFSSDRNQVTTVVYDMEVLKVITDYKAYELDTLQKFAAAHYPGLDTLAEGFYYKSITEGTGDSVTVGSSIRYNYVGKLLNGYVFDTNIEDTARKYRIYDSSRDYSPQTFEVHEVGNSNTSDESVVDGFAKALLNMMKGGKAITFFGSEWGYKDNVQSFGRKQQLHFYIEVLKE